MSKTKALVPELRFPEFLNDSEWEKEPLNNLSKRLRRKVGTKELTPVSITAGLGFVDQTKKFGRRIAGEQYKNYIHIRRGDFVYNKGNSKTFAQGCIYQLKEFEEAAASTAFICFKLNQGCVDHYFQSLFECNTHGKELRKFITSGARSDGLLNINPTDFFSIELPLPPTKDEQQKIADCLGSLDDLIAAHSAKLNALQDHKKGLLQQLFPAEGETTPKLRFPEFEGDGEWKEDKLKKAFSIFQGYAFSSKDSTNEGVRWLKIADVGIQRMNPETPSFLPLARKNEFQKFKVSQGDYVVALTRPYLNHRLKIAKVNNTYDGALLNQRVGKLLSDQNIDFVYYLLQTSLLSNMIEKQIAGNDPPNLSSQQISDIPIRTPKPAEQQRIADCLSDLDSLISAQSEQIAALKEHKKGLMQQLFPNPDLNKV